MKSYLKLLLLSYFILSSGCGEIVSNLDQSSVKGFDLSFTLNDDINLINISSYPLSGRCVPQYNDISVDVGNPILVSQTFPCVNGEFSGVIDLSSAGLPEGLTQIIGSQLSLTASASVQVLKDTIIPSTPVILNPLNGASFNAVSITISGTCETDTTVNLFGDLVGSPLSVACVASAFTIPAILVLGNGAKSISATQTDGVGNTSVADVISVNLGILPLVPTISTPTAGLETNLVAQTVSGICETGTTVNIFGDVVGAPVTTSCVANAYSFGVTLTALNGLKTINVSQTNGAGTSPTASRNITLDDVVPVAPTIGTPVNGSFTNTTAQTVTGACETGATINISGDFIGSPLTAACVASAYTRAITLTAAQGSKAISATQTDLASNTSASTNISITFDSLVPSAPTIATPVNGSFTNNTAQTVTGSCETGSTVNLSGAFTGSPVTASCVANAYTQAITLTAAQGSKAISTTQTDLAGNTSAVTNISVTYDTLAPAVPTIATPVNGSFTNTTAHTVTGACETGATINISGDFTGSPLTATCVTSAYSRAITLTAAEGVKAISATQTDLALNTSAATNISLTLDITLPAAPTIVTPANGSLTNSGSQVVTGACETGATVSISGGIVASPQTTTCAASAYSRLVVLSAGDGSKALSAVQTDPAGNISSATNISLTIDTGVPSAPTIITPVSGTFTNTTAQTVTGACETGATVNLSGAFTGSPLTAACVSSTYSQAITLTAAQGSKAISATQTDGASNTSVAANISITYDTLAPTAPTIATPVNGSFTNTTAQTVTGSCETGATVNISGDFTGSPLTAACAASAYSRAITLTGSQGSKSISATQTDQASNTSVAANISITYDTLVPAAPTIATPINGSVTNTTAQTVTGSCETGATVNISGAFTGSPVTAACVGSAYSRAITLTATQGSKAIAATQTDVAGNTSAATNISITFDSTAPSAPNITTPVNGSFTNTTAQTVTGACETGATVNLSGDFTGSPVTAACVASAYSQAITLTASQGSKAISATQTDLAGNTSAATNISLILDTVAPSAPTITNPVNASTVFTVSQTVTGACETGSTVNISGDIVGSPVTTSCAANAYSRAVTLTAAFAVKAINVTQTDLALNTSTSIGITLGYTNLNVTYPATITLTKHTIMTTVNPTIVAGTPTSYSISPALPSGLTFDTVTGAISGIPNLSNEVGSNYTVTINDIYGSITRVVFLRILIPNFTWLGTAGDGLWNTGTNWRGNIAPTSTNTAIFDDECQATGNCNANINVNSQVRRLYMKPLYTGTITQDPGITFQVGNRTATAGSEAQWGKMQIDNGVFVGGNSNLTIDKLNITGGVFTSTSGVLRLGAVHTSSRCSNIINTSDNTTNQADCGLGLSATGVFNHNNGTVWVNSNANTLDLTTFAFNSDQTINLYDLIFENNSASSGSFDGRRNRANAFIYGTVKVVNVANSILWRDGNLSFGELRFQGLNATFECDAVSASDRCSDMLSFLESTEQPAAINRAGLRVHTMIRFNRSDGMAQTYTFDDGAAAPGFIIDNPNGVTPIPTNPPVGYFRLGRLTIQQGNFGAPPHLSFGEGTDTSFASTSSNLGLNVVSGTFVHNNGLVSLDSVTTYTDSRNAFIIQSSAGPISFFDFTLDIEGGYSSAGAPDGYLVNILSGTAINIYGDFNWANGNIFSVPSSPNLYVYGDLNLLCANFANRDCYGSNNTQFINLNLVGNFNTNLTFESGGSGRLGVVRLIINKGLTTNRVTLIGNGGAATSSFGSQVMSITQGIFDIGTYQFFQGWGLNNNGQIHCSVGVGYLQHANALAGTPAPGDMPACYGN